ncbi:MAG: type 4a pilus biogenesis protein PilO [Deltaproteobacteria bacterium]|nr:type 4a pilus biogenesis protein PilO [Deltaproteobacteria bacterium]
MDINLDDLRKLSLKMKALIVVGICLLLGYFYYMFFFQAIVTKQTALSAKLTDLDRQIVEKQKVVAQLDRYMREVNVLRESFKLALMKLPNSREIAGLLASVVLSGEEAGVNFLLFEPKPPEPKLPEPKPGTAPKPADAKAQAAKPADAKAAAAKAAVPEKFYDEIPIKVQIAGSFHNTVSFYAKVAKLPRIVNVEDITMGEAKNVKGKGWIIRTSCIIKTYMFVDKKT